MRDLAGSLPIQREQLDNGLVILANERPGSELIVVRGSYMAGPILDPKGESGLSRFVGDMMMRGTKKRSYLQIIDEVESLGAGIRFYAGEDVAWSSARCTPSSFDKTMEILMDCTMNPTFPEDEMEKVRGTMLTRVKQREDSTAAVASRLVREMLFPKGNPYHYDPGGYEETINAISRDDVKKFWENHYGPESTILSFSGNITMQEILDKLERHSPGWESRGPKPKMPSIAVERPVKATRKVHPMMHKSQVDIAVACQTVPRTHPDNYPLDLANAILGRIGLMGRLGKNIRDRQGLAYYAASTYAPRITGGYWMAYAGVNPANVQKALSSIYQEMGRISASTVTKREHGDVMTNKVGFLALRLETCGGSAGFMHDIEIHRLGLDYVDRYEEIIRSVGREDIQRVCQEYIREEEAPSAIVGPYQE